MIELLRASLPNKVYLELPDVIEQFKIATPLRLAHFLAQCKHESWTFKATRENLNYRPDALKKVFGKYFPGDLATKYAWQPERIANRVYANRLGNGDEASGDGWKYRGGGYIQITGRVNYAGFDASVVDNIIDRPELVATKYPLLSAAWFWDTRKLNGIADRGGTDTEVTQVTKRVNGGTNGLADRIHHFKTYYNILT
jgi:putative chitinase